MFYAIIENSIKKLKFLDNFLTLTIIALLVSIVSFAQNEGDYQSFQSGSWQTSSNWQIYSSGSWTAATNYPGEVGGDYTVTILYGHAISISSAGISTEEFSNLIISGTLNLNGETSNSTDFIINTPSIYVTPFLTPYATIYFVDKCALWLPSNATIRVWTGGLSGDCSNNQEIHIGDAFNVFAACNGAPGNIFTFAELMASGGTLNAEISNSSDSICIGTTINLNGSYLGAVANSPTYEWSSSGPEVLSFSLSSTNQNVSTTPTTPGTYFIKLTVNTINEGTLYSNTDSIKVIVEEKSLDPTSVSASQTTIMSGNSTTLTLNGGGGGTSEQIFWYSESCGNGLVGTGNNIIVSPTEETTYYGRYENSSPCNYNTTCSQITISVIPFANVWEGNTSTDFGTTSNWQGNVVPTNGEDILFASNPINNCILDRDFSVDQIINASSKHFIVSNHELTITNNIDFTGTGKMYADSTLAEIVFAGISSQTLNTSIFYTNKISNLEIRNASAVTLDGDLYISNQLKLSSGNFVLSSNTIELTGYITYSGGAIVGGENSNMSFQNCNNEVELQDISLNNLTINSINGIRMSGNVIVQGVLDLDTGTLFINSNELVISGTIQRTNGKIEASFAADLIEFANLVLISIPAGSFISKIYNLKINGGGISLTEDITIDNTIEFITGNITTNENIVILTNLSGAIIGAGSGKYINGYCRKIGNTSFEFPVGNESLYAPISISAAQDGGSNSDYFTASYYHQMPHDLYDSTQYEPDIVRISEKEYWILDRNGTNNVSVTLSWDLRSGHINELSELTVARWDGLTWQDEGNSGTTGNINSGTITSDYVTNFSPFTLASKDIEKNLLPVDLVNFSSICSNNIREIFWETASETNNNYFEIEWSVDVENWEFLDRINGAGNSNGINYYSIIDNLNYNNNVYYRLKQYDFNGSCKIFNYIYSEKCTYDNYEKCLLYPNPAKDFINIDAEGFVLAEITGVLGNMIIQSKNKKINVSTLDKGSYFVKIHHKNKITTKKFLLY